MVYSTTHGTPFVIQKIEKPERVRDLTDRKFNCLIMWWRVRGVEKP